MDGTNVKNKNYDEWEELNISNDFLFGKIMQDAELCEYYGVMDPAMVPGRMFTIGEKQLIMDAMSEINDLKDAKAQLDEAKNS